MAPEPVPSLALLFSRPPSSVLAKMANLDGSRSHGGKHDVLAGAILRDEPAHFTHIYRVLLQAARAERIGPDRLPDFLGLEHGGEFTLLSQNELSPSALENAFRDQIAKAAQAGIWTERETERIFLAAARVGQHLFAQNVLANCGQQCVFCGLKPTPNIARRMLVAGHIKPWKDSTSAERMDVRNGLAACPSHDVAFDTGLLAVDANLKIQLSRGLDDAVHTDPLARQYYGRPPLRDALILPPSAQLPATKYLDWHQANIFAA
ncbi:MAG: HNH endonuclease [Streptosporangiaceae bacterium]